MEDRGISRSIYIMNTSAKRMYDWNSISWQKLEKSVFKLQKRIYQASCRDDKKTVLTHEYCQMSSDKTYAMTMHHFTEEPYEGKLSRTVLETSANREVCA